MPPVPEGSSAPPEITPPPAEVLASPVTPEAAVAPPAPVVPEASTTAASPLERTPVAAPAPTASAEAPTNAAGFGTGNFTGNQAPATKPEPSGLLNKIIGFFRKR